MPPPAEPGPSGPAPPPVTADDLQLTVHRAVDALRPAPADGWERMAGTLEWDCWETVEHLADDLFAYAVQLGPRRPPPAADVPFARESRRTGGPANAVHADRSAGPDGLLQVLEACGALLTAMVRTAPPHVRAHHVYGASDPEGFAAMGIAETLVHTHDVAQGLGLPWEPPPGPCARALARLFPDAPADPDVPTDPWPVLLWCTGRADLPGRPRPATWRWYGEPRP
ncbi:hypothetical protein ACG5V6_03625 [Streptomyces chitinivorans]|uniref:Mycothiol-dependent maleylpyruvate isomerase metal-binding domain-containing protein n=1 Tax=Streptomyces chitinivorans TaxID=1257027 RepID=A0ABW7HNF0_9ACTN|nr:hypothetical protein [Streptomyces chitinivorans]MDH2411139.1 hypothetical protein [Streptomyces chitinivorans]